jgi:PadR family transcriptional regulator, regulatory protein AphA
MAEAPKHHGSISPEYALLGLLCLQPSHGYDLHQRLVSDFGFVWHVSQSQTYNILKRLEAQEDITSTTRPQEKLPPRQMLRITRQGRQRFDKWLEAPTGSSVRAIRLEFLTRLYFARKLAPEKIPFLLDSEAAEIQSALTRLELNQANLTADQTFNRLSLRLRIRQLHSTLDWLNECRKALA